MKTKTEVEKIKAKFYTNKDGELDIDSYGVYRLGLTSEEINTYLQARAGRTRIKGLRDKFNEIAGCNTCACTPEGKMLMYRFDVLRFADVLFGKTKGTFFD